MSDLQQYIVEEWAEEYREGRLHRREFLRRTVLLADGVALAAPVLQRLGVAASDIEIADAASAHPPAVAQASAVTVAPNDPAIDTAGMVSFPSGAVGVQAYLAKPKTSAPVPGVIVIHENRGLLEHFKDICRRFAKLGYAALAVDLASQEGGTAKFSDAAEVTAVLGRTPPEQMVAMLNAGVRFLQAQPQVRRERIGAMGFCFGGGMTWRLATQNEELKAAAPFYGPNPPLGDVAKIKAAVLAVYGALDQRINAGIPAVRDAMSNARVVHEIVIYPNAGHAFFNDTGASYNATAAKEAWTKTLGWFDNYLKK